MAKKIALDCAEKDDFSKRMEFRKKSNDRQLVSINQYKPTYDHQIAAFSRAQIETYF